MEKGATIPIIIKKKVETTGPLEVNIRHKDVTKREFHQEQVSLDKIVSDSDSKFYITGKTTKINFINFVQLITKHDIGEVEGLQEEEVVVSSDLITRVATASVIDEDEESMKYIDAVAIGVFIASFILSLFILLTKTIADLKTFGWILLIVSAIFLLHYTIRGIKSGELSRIWRILLKSLMKK